MILFLLLLLSLACIIKGPPGLSAKDPPGPPADIWTAKGPPRDCIAESGPHETRKKPPEKHKNKDNITCRKDRKSYLLRAVFGARCFQDPRPVAAGRHCPTHFNRVKWESNVNRGWPGREEKKEINQNKPRARTRMCKICA